MREVSESNCYVEGTDNEGRTAHNDNGLMPGAGCVISIARKEVEGGEQELGSSSTANCSVDTSGFSECVSSGLINPVVAGVSRGGNDINITAYTASIGPAGH